MYLVPNGYTVLDEGYSRVVFMDFGEQGLLLHHPSFLVGWKHSQSWLRGALAEIFEKYS